MTKTIFYKKVGRRYVPISEYDSEYLDSFPKGSHLVQVYPGGSSRRFNINPNYVAMIAAGRIAEDAISRAVYQATEVRPKRKAMTRAEIDAWNNLIKVWGEEARGLVHPSAREVAEAGVAAMVEEAEKLLQNESVRKAYEHFMLMCELTKENHGTG